MKNLVLTIICLVGVAAALSCKREKVTDPIFPWSFTFILVDSSGQKLFPEPPPNIRKFPFDPSKSFWIDGLGINHPFYLKGNDSFGLVFSMYRLPKDLNKDSNYVNSQMLHWKVYLHPDSTPINFIVKNPDIQSSLADYVLWNGDTLNYYFESAIREIVYP